MAKLLVAGDTLPEFKEAKEEFIDKHKLRYTQTCAQCLSHYTLDESDFQRIRVHTGMGDPRGYYVQLDAYCPKCQSVRNHYEFDLRLPRSKEEPEPDETERIVRTPPQQIKQFIKDLFKK